MGENEFAVALLLNTIMQRLNTTGCPRSEIACDWRDSHGLSIDANALSGREFRLGDIACLCEQQADIDDPTLKLPADLMALHSRGRTVGGFADRNEYYDLFPE